MQLRISVVKMWVELICLKVGSGRILDTRGCSQFFPAKQDVFPSEQWTFCYTFICFSSKSARILLKSDEYCLNHTLAWKYTNRRNFSLKTDFKCLLKFWRGKIRILQGIFVALFCCLLYFIDRWFCFGSSSWWFNISLF
jgi:hypothetical protein